MKLKNWLSKEDSWAIVIGLFLVLVATLLWVVDGFWVIKLISVKFSSWDSLSFSATFKGVGFVNIIALFVFFIVWFSFVAVFTGKELKKFYIGFGFIFVLSIVVFLISANKTVKSYQMEAPLIALLVGLIIGNFTTIGKKLGANLLTEFYVKIGIVLMGATLPITLLVSAGAVAIIQACIITIITFSTIFFVATRMFGLDPSFGATLGAGGSICGVSAAIIIGSASNAKKEHVGVTISIVVFWAVIWVILLPIICKALGLDAGVAGAWIGTSEFADSAGLAAASAMGDERAIAAFTLIKVIGRDMFIGIWAVLVAFLSVAYWNKQDNAQVTPRTIWERFPKFIIGFLLASVLVSLFVVGLDEAASDAYSKEVLGSLKTLRNWVFTWTFLCIGITASFRDIISVGYKPFVAFCAGVVVNLPLGFILSNYVFVDFWTNFMR